MSRNIAFRRAATPEAQVQVQLANITQRVATTDRSVRAAVAESRMEAGGALPTAGSANRGRIYMLKGASGVADITYICRKTAADTYEWIALH